MLPSLVVFSDSSAAPGVRCETKQPACTPRMLLPPCKTTVGRGILHSGAEVSLTAKCQDSRSCILPALCLRASWGTPGIRLPCSGPFLRGDMTRLLLVTARQGAGAWGVKSPAAGRGTPLWKAASFRLVGCWCFGAPCLGWGCSGTVAAGGGGCGGACREGLLCAVSCQPWQTRSLSRGKEHDPGQWAGWEVSTPLGMQLPSMQHKLIRARTVLRLDKGPVCFASPPSPGSGVAPG